ncbi:MAG: family 16 glycosylhydrolase [Melioribacteraceae bacterium]|nr:family 16 glycosylhydrolase [Melioribacteraceae bacterium]
MRKIMIRTYSMNCRYFILTFILIYICTTPIFSQGLIQVWADEFNENNIDRSAWGFEYGTANDNVHYFTDRLENAKIENGKLQIIALEESYKGFNYTAALLKTHNSIFWKYGRIEARLNLPSSNGFVPAFWMLPQDQSYGFWPSSGEIDIVEHPTNQVDKIYGTVHTGTYNSFTGSGPRGSVITIADAETEFHVYAIEWTPNKIDFFVDDQKYYTFDNELTGSGPWPFDQPFYIILSMGVGGGWVGNPDASSIFPAIMEVDYVRVYQKLNDVAISGADELAYHTKNSTYSLPFVEGASYFWNVTGNAEIVSGQNTNEILVDWNIFSGIVEVEMVTADSTYNYDLPVLISNNLLVNSGFEKGVNHWNKTRPYPGDIEFMLNSEVSHSGNNSLFVDVKTVSANAWDVQLSQSDLFLESGKNYNASFWAKAKTSGIKINAAIINSNTFAPIDIKEITLTDIWAKYDLSFTPSITVIGQFNIDMGGHLGSYYFDDFSLSFPELDDENQITNSDFSIGNVDWVFNSFFPAQAIGEVKNGEFAVSITNGGSNLWDIHLGQENITCESGKEYTVSFDAYADASREISAIVGKNSDPWTVYSGDQIISLTKEKKTYSYSFLMSNPTDNLARMGFDLGKSAVNVYFDNIVLSKGILPTKVENEENLIENSYVLYQNYPNPFNPCTTIKYSIKSKVKSQKSKVKIVVYDVIGTEVAILVDVQKSAGTYKVDFNASNLSSGVYYYKLTAGEFFTTKKMLVLK